MDETLIEKYKVGVSVRVFGVIFPHTWGPNSYLCYSDEKILNHTNPFFSLSLCHHSMHCGIEGLCNTVQYTLCIRGSKMVSKYLALNRKNARQDPLNIYTSNNPPKMNKLQLALFDRTDRLSLIL